MDLLTPSEVAEFLGVSPVTIRAWARKGFISAELTQGGHRRFAREDVIDFAHRFGIKPRVNQQANRVLIIDSDPAHATFLAEQISAIHYQPKVEVASELFGAGVRVGELDPDLVIIELLNPMFDGVKVCSQIKQRNPMTRVIGLIRQAQVADEREFQQAGGETCLMRPVDLGRLYHLLGSNQATEDHPESPQQRVM
ncbi:MAG: helix-turn-helix domain-containing protein [Pseudomonadales bacterium]|nr:helix-turn-helix domain-containing protein [Pseudomonadales bacterium]